MLTYPAFDPVALHLGPLSIRWYGIAYVAGILLGWQCCAWLCRKELINISQKHIDDFIPWATLGIVVGGRLGEVFFYNPAYYLSHPLEILYIWQPGMSFHGGFLGVVLAGILWVHTKKIPWITFGDLLSVGTPIGLFFGRIANFVNAELYGRITDAPWGMIFPHAGPFPRHPSQLYEAGLEGLLLFTILFSLARRGVAKKYPGLLLGVFLAGYGLARSFVELFRQPDDITGFIWGEITMGQLLSLPLIFVGGLFVWRALCRPFPPKSA
ncbi:MAG: prolipoprotein diacylglyceryl transferase [Alphaproteobacteria bacterium]|jgi:phosphatidylglycerol:prolipoprotein diacylglycerol transferase|nr:prolipoprotein diacylglyceryl transferase [Alphaproteobacteria bacterium]